MEKSDDTGSGDYPIDTPPIPTQPVSGETAGPPRFLASWATFRWRGIFNFTFTIPDATEKSVVAVSLTEIRFNFSEITPFMGLATLKVYNIVPRPNGQVDVRGHVDWGSDINVRIGFIYSV
jgi:hypothetical protein